VNARARTLWRSLRSGSAWALERGWGQSWDHLSAACATTIQGGGVMVPNLLISLQPAESTEFVSPLDCSSVASIEFCNQTTSTTKSQYERGVAEGETIKRYSASTILYDTKQKQLTASTRHLDKLELPTAIATSSPHLRAPKLLASCDTSLDTSQHLPTTTNS
jgi:hypothetical protein